MTRLVRCAWVALGTAGSAFGLGSAASGQGGWHESERGAVRLIAGARAAGLADGLVLGLEVRLKPGWKTYWRYAGQAGYPPQFDWQGSRNIAASPHILWPRPERFEISGIDIVGYQGRVVLPLHVRLLSPGKEAEVRLRLAYAVCREVCVPEEARLHLVLPAGGPRRGAHAAEIERFAALAPQPAATYGWKLEFAGYHVERAAEREARAFFMVTLAAHRQRFAAPDLIVEGGHGETFGRASVRLVDGGRRAHFTLPYARTGGGLPGDAIKDLTLTALDGHRYATLAVQLGGDRH